MKLWLLRPRENRPEWSPWFDKCFGFVVRADTEQEARKLAQQYSLDRDYREVFTSDYNSPTQEISAWLDSMCSTCTELMADGDRGVIIKDFHAA